MGITAIGGSLGGKSSESFSMPGVEAQKGADLLMDRFSARSATVQAVVGAPDGASLEGRADELDAYAGAIEKVEGVTSVAPAEISPNGKVARLDVTFGTDPSEMDESELKDLEEASAPLRDAGLTTAFGGDLMVQGEEPASEMIGLVVAIVVLLFAFGSVIAMGLPILTALVGLMVGLGGITAASAFVDISDVAPMLATMIGLAVGIDYALFIVTRHRQFMAEGHLPGEAAARSVATAGGAVLFAGVTVIIAITGLAFAGIPMVTIMGLSVAAVVTVSVSVALTLLPAMLGFAGLKIDKLKVPGLKVKAEDDGSSLSGRWARRVTDRPLPWLLGSLAVLGLLAVPLASLRLGMTDAGNNAPGTTGRVAYDLLADGFGPGYNGPLMVVVDLGNAEGADPEATAGALAAAIGEDPGIVAAFPAGVNEDGDVALVTAIPTTSPQDAETSTLVHRLRHDVIPAAAGGTDVYVTGTSAYFIDMSDLLSSRLPLFIFAVIGLSFLLLMAVFRSVLVPLKAAVANLLSIGGAYGVIVAVFQWGWGKDLIGLKETVPVVAFVPMMMFAILFGLSMDYEVFILSRVREEYMKTGNPHTSVVTGIASSARVITAAALIMVSVFGSFILGLDPIIKMFGLGLSVAVLLDATIVRMVFVPATMALLGERNWWLPKWLDRILPNLDIEGAHLFDREGKIKPADERTEAA
jgi:RND superfamily putative drug exporter